MAEQSVSRVAEIFSAPSSDPAVMVCDGYGLSIVVRCGQLQVTDGIGRTRRVRTIARVPRTVQRLVILGNTGMISLEATRFLADTGIQWAQLDSMARILAISGATDTDARLLRAQSRAHSDGDLAAVGQEITRYLLSVKQAGQADNLDKYFSGNGADIIRQLSPDSAEGAISQTYWQAWSGRVAVPWSPQDLLKVPAHWSGFTQRSSLNGRQPINADASDPVNSILNFLYRVAETECVHALHAVGLSPILGISHTDKAGRDSMALDLLETLRPLCDRIALEILAPDGMIPYVNGKPAYIDRRWFTETREGTCRLVAPLTHKLASYAAELGEAIAPHAYKVAQMLAHAASGIVTVRKPVKPAKPTGIHRGMSLVRLRPGVAAAQIIPDAIWEQIEPILPARPYQPRGRNAAPVSRDVAACIVIRYMLKCGWSQVPITDKKLVNRWYDFWRESGAWAKAERVLTDTGHLAALLV
jgi:CRISPR/Cas system-associated endonuclease Cas1